MKRRFAAVAALAVLLVCALAGAALAEETPDTPDATLETEVSIGFEGAVYFVDMGSEGMDIDFDSQMIPPHGSNAVLYAPDGSHTLRVCDRRAAPGKWTVYAITTPFVSGTESLTGWLNFMSPIVTTGLTPRLVGPESDQYTNIYIDSRKIIEATESLAPGEHDLTSTAGNTMMWLPVAEVAKIKPLEYSATVTWTLVLEP